MASARETAIAALFAHLVAELAEADVTLVVRNAAVPLATEELGGAPRWVNVVDGEPGEPEVSLSPTLYHYEHAAVVELLVFESTAGQVDAEYDALAVAVGEALDGETLGGAVTTGVHLENPEEAEPIGPGADVVAKGGSIIAVLHYTTSNPLT